MFTGLLTLVAIVGCDDTTFNTGEGGTVDTDGYDGVVQVFEANCNSCHSAATATAGLDLETDPCGTLVGQQSATYGAVFVEPGDASASVLWHKMDDSGTYGGVMPTGGKLADTTVAIVADWIDDGAPCDGGSTDDSGTGDDGDGGGDTGTAAATLADVQSQVFTPICTGCHIAPGGDEDPAGWMSLTDGDSHGQLVGVTATMNHAKVRVSAGDPDNSFIMDKLRGELTSDEGEQMPKNDNLTDDQIALVESWIAAGANP